MLRSAPFYHVLTSAPNSYNLTIINTLPYSFLAVVPCPCSSTCLPDPFQLRPRPRRVLFRNPINAPTPIHSSLLSSAPYKKGKQNNSTSFQYLCPHHNNQSHNLNLLKLSQINSTPRNHIILWCSSSAIYPHPPPFCFNFRSILCIYVTVTYCRRAPITFVPLGTSSFTFIIVAAGYRQCTPSTF